LAAKFERSVKITKTDHKDMLTLKFNMSYILTMATTTMLELTVTTEGTNQRGGVHMYHPFA